MERLELGLDLGDAAQLRVVALQAAEMVARVRGGVVGPRANGELCARFGGALRMRTARRDLEELRHRVFGGERGLERLGGFLVLATQRVLDELRELLESLLSLLLLFGGFRLVLLVALLVLLLARRNPALVEL